VLFLFVVMMLDIDVAQLREGFTRYAPLGGISEISGRGGGVYAGFAEFLHHFSRFFCHARIMVKFGYSCGRFCPR